ncbi:hypothetical protein CRYUN_Cryun21dG0088200 [Craigia yunnanensis]
MSHQILTYVCFQAFDFYNTSISIGVSINYWSPTENYPVEDVRKQVSVAFSEALFPLFTLLFFIPILQARNLQQCSSSCGDFKNISYPFRLQGDPVGCGDLGFQLSCQNNKTILNYRGGKYYVKGISYDERTIRIVDINLANGSCGLPYGSLSMGEATDS